MYRLIFDNYAYCFYFSTIAKKYMIFFQCRLLNIIHLNTLLNSQITDCLVKYHVYLSLVVFHHN